MINIPFQNLYFLVVIVIGFLTEKDLDDVVVTPSRRPHEAAHLVQASRVHVDAAREQLLGDVGVALQRRSEPFCPPSKRF